MPPPRTTKDPSKMSRTALFNLYTETVAEKGEITARYGKIYKKYRHAKKVIATGRDAGASVQRTKIPYPTGETPGRGEFNLATFLLMHSEVSKETYNAFLVATRDAMTAAGIQSATLWRDVPVGPLSEVLDVIRDQHPWLNEYENDWPVTSTVKQFLRNSRNNLRRKSRKAATHATTTASTTAVATALDQGVGRPN